MKRVFRNSNGDINHKIKMRRPENKNPLRERIKQVIFIVIYFTSGCLAVVYSAWSAIVAPHRSVIVFSLDLELRLLHSFGTIGPGIGESSDSDC